MRHARFSSFALVLVIAVLASAASDVRDSSREAGSHSAGSRDASSYASAPSGGSNTSAAKSWDETERGGSWGGPASAAHELDPGGPVGAEPSQRSGGSYQLHQTTAGVLIGPFTDRIDRPEPPGRTIGTAFEGFDFDDNATETGLFWIPPDPIGAAGSDRLIAVVNVMIEARDKAGTLLWRDSLRDFFASLSPDTFLFDPKVVYDHYESRFVVVALEKVETGSNPDPGNESRIMLAVSKTATPATATAADWYYHAIDGKETIDGVECWADYPGFEVDEEAVYITNNMYEFEGGADTYSMRLWIVDKGVVGGFYGGGAAAVVRYDPFGAAGWAGSEVTMMPALVYGAGGVAPGVGTFLVGYSGWTWGGPGGNEGLVVIRVNNPLGAAAFTARSFPIGDIEDVGGVYGWPALEDAPQPGTSTRIEVNDRRALDAVWRSNALWLTTTINPNSGPDAGQTTAHWIKLDTSTWPPSLSDQGDIGGEDLDAVNDVFTYFPALAVNAAGDAKFGFCASSAGVYAGAYATGRRAGDPAGTVQPTETVRAGQDYYVRTFGTPRNRWGDFTGASVDPTDDSVFWVFNQYAMTRGSGSPPEDGRWGTAWANCTIPECVNNQGCDDNVFCNGAETCDLNDECQDGDPPCDSADLCDEDQDLCLPDCNGNLIPDGLDISGGTSQDCQPNGVPDTCELHRVFSSDMDSATGWRVNATPDVEWEFGFDFTTMGIPPSPGGSTTGLLMKANLAAPQGIDFVVATPMTLEVSGNYVVEFDFWINANGPFPGGGTGSTEFLGGGVGYDGVSPERNGALMLINGEGGTTRDWRMFKDTQEQTYGSLQYHLPVSNDHTDPLLQASFPSQSPPVWQQANYPQQTGAIYAGCGGFAWHHMVITARSQAIGSGVTANQGTTNFTVDGVSIGTLDNSNGGLVVDMAGNVQIMYADIFTSISDNPDLSFGVVDNFVVTVHGDCNTNGIPDECDIASGTSNDFNGNGIPDECDGPFCGNANCDPGEDPCNCAADCGTPPATETACSDGIDNDCDSLTDCADTDCDTDLACSCGDATCDPWEGPCNCPADCGTPPATETACSDGIDNDCDSLTDLADPDCSGPVCPFTCGDISGSGGLVDLVDFASFAVCFGGPADVSQACTCSDLNGDGTVNLLDSATFALTFGGVSTNAPPNCP